MKRLLYDKLLNWKNSKFRKPLLLQGARQVGKTYLINDFGKNEYGNFIQLNFEKDSNLVEFFKNRLEPDMILENISLYINQKIPTENTLIFFDEVQVAPEIITSLKYFHENRPDLHIIAAGSLLGISIGRMASFPVGKVNFLTLYPMSFIEFLLANGENLLIEKLTNLSLIESLPEVIHNRMIDYLKKYLYFGGMPEVIDTYLQTKDISLVRQLQYDILEAYKNDFSKYTSKNQAIKTSELWHSIPNQLAKENKKFKYSDVRKKGRANMYIQTIQWLKDAGLINLVYNISTPKIPLSGYSDKSKFKVYMFDTGLLGAMLNLSSDMITYPEKIFKEYNGAFIENFVVQELVASEFKELFYWTSRSDAEVDIILQLVDKIIPLEIKSGTSLRMKSLRSYAEKYKPQLIIRASIRNFTVSGNFVNIPLYYVFAIRKMIKLFFTVD